MSNRIKSFITQIYMVAARSARVFVSFAGVARIVLRACIGNGHDDTGTITPAVATAIINARDLVAITTHSFWT